MGIDKFNRKASANVLEGRKGVYSFGMPVFPSLTQLFKGSVYHVDSGHANASDNNEGSDPNRPMATLDAAVAKCTASNGDVILVSEGHAETITAANAIDLDVAGISVIGLGQGALRPTITFGTANAASIRVNAANVRLENFLFVCDKDGVTAMLDVDKTDFTLVGCEFREGSAKQWVAAVDINGGAANACDRAKVYGCRFKSLAAGASRAIELGAVADSVELVGNWIEGDWTDAGIHNPADKVLTNLLIKDNVVSNLNTGNHAIELVSACTGSLIDNRMYGDTLGTILDPGSLKCSGNLETDAIDQAGVASPTTAAGGLGIGAITAATFAAGAIDAAAIANSAIDAATFAAGAIDAAAIANGAIDAATFAAGAIDAAAIANGAIDAATFAAGAIDAAAIANGAIDAATFAAGAIDAAAIANGAIDAATFAAGAIDAAAIANGAIDAATFAAGAIDAAALAADAVAEIADGVTDEAVSGHTAAGTVGAMLQPLQSGTAQAGAAGSITLAAAASATDSLYNSSVVQVVAGTGAGQTRLITGYTGATKVATVAPNWTTTPDNTSVYVLHPLAAVQVQQFAAGAITAAAIATDAVDADAMADGAITAATFAAGAIDAAAIANGAIDAATFAAGAIDAAAIANAAIDAATFAAGAIDAAAIANGAIDAATFAAGAIDAAAIATNAIDADAMADGAITAATFAAGAIDATAIANGAIDAATFAVGAIDAAAIANNAIDAATYATDVGAWRIARSDWNFAADTGAVGAYNIFTVTGDVLLQIIGVCETSLTSAGAPTVELGVAGNTAALIAQIVNGTDLISPEIWLDATPTTTVEAVNFEGSRQFVVTNGQDVIFTIGGVALTAGKINFYALWKPLSTTGNVVAV